MAGAAFGAILSAALAWRAGMSPLAVVVLMTIAADGFGGVVVNATGSNKRGYTVRAAPTGFHMLYMAAHAHPFVVALVVPGFSWTAAVVVYASVLSAALAITRSTRARCAGPSPPCALRCASQSW